MEKQIKIIIRGGNIQHIESNFDCKIQIIDFDNMDEIAPKKPNYPDLICDVNKFIFESHIAEGDKVNYLPKLSGYDNKKVLTVDKIWFEESSDLDSAFGIKEPKFLCSFIELPNLVSNVNDVEKVSL